MQEQCVSSTDSAESPQARQARHGAPCARQIGSSGERASGSWPRLYCSSGAHCSFRRPEQRPCNEATECTTACAAQMARKQARCGARSRSRTPLGGARACAHSWCAARWPGVLVPIFRRFLHFFAAPGKRIPFMVVLVKASPCGSVVVVSCWPVAHSSVHCKSGGDGAAKGEGADRGAPGDRGGLGPHLW
jgi:hypothetical protein